MKMRHTVPALGIVALAAVLAFSGENPAAGQGGPHGFRALNLSPEQKDQMHSIRQEHRGTFGPKMKELGELRRELRAQVYSDAPDEPKIDELKGKIAALHSAILASEVDLDRRTAALLTPEQRKVMASLPSFQGHGRRHGAWGEKE